MSGMQYGRDRTFKSGADLSAKQYYLAKADSTQNQVVLAAAATDKILGVILDGGKQSGDAVRIGLLNGDGTLNVVAGGTIAIGDYLTSDSNGKAVATTTTGDTV